MPNPSGNPFPNPSGNPFGNPYSERRATPAPTPSPTPLTSVTSDQQTPGSGKTSTTTRIRSISPADALARLVTDLRPDWRPDDVRAWALTDDRPWAVVVATGITRATDPAVRLPAGLRHVGPAARSEAPRIPTVAEYRAITRCDHGAEADRCALCRRHIPAEETP
jgi:hypothetical protein